MGKKDGVGSAKEQNRIKKEQIKKEKQREKGMINKSGDYKTLAEQLAENGLKLKFINMDGNW